MLKVVYTTKFYRKWLYLIVAALGYAFKLYHWISKYESNSIWAPFQFRLHVCIIHSYLGSNLSWGRSGYKTAMCCTDAFIDYFVICCDVRPSTGVITKHQAHILIIKMHIFFQYRSKLSNLIINAKHSQQRFCEKSSMRKGLLRQLQWCPLYPYLRF